MKTFKLFSFPAFLLVLSFGLLLSLTNKVVAQTTSSSSGGTAALAAPVPDTYTIKLSGNELKSTTALNITVAFTPTGSAQIDTGVTFKANGATTLLSDVNSANGLITVVWSGSVTDGVVTISGKLKKGSVTGTPSIAVTKVEKSGGVNITSSLATVASLSSSVPPPPAPPND